MWHDTAQPPAVAYTAEESAAMDRWLVAERGISIRQLMDTAGSRLADVIRELLLEHDGTRVVFLVGPGNNGGDALVARELLADETETTVWLPLAGAGAPRLDGRSLLVDGLFGVGLGRPVEGAARAAIEHVNGASAFVLAVDVPSGLSATSGDVVGVGPRTPDGGVAVRADRSLSFVGPKAGFFRGAGPVHVGLWRAVDIGFPVSEAEAWVRARRAAGTER